MVNRSIRVFFLSTMFIVAASNSAYGATSGVLCAKGNKLIVRAKCKAKEKKAA